MSEKCTKTQAEQEYVRKNLAGCGKKNKDIEEITGINHGNISRFLSGRQKMSDASIEKLYETGLVPRPKPEDLEEKKDQTNPPLEGWTGEVKSVADAAHEKGYSAATVRKYCKRGVLNYVMVGKRMAVAMDEKYVALRQTELGRLRFENARLEAENAHLKEQVENMQLEFSWQEPASDHDSDVCIAAIEPPEVDFAGEDEAHEAHEAQQAAQKCICNRADECRNGRDGASTCETSMSFFRSKNARQRW